MMLSGDGRSRKSPWKDWTQTLEVLWDAIEIREMFFLLGVIITCNLPNRVKTATRDIIRLFELHWAAINPDADKKSTTEEGTANVSESIEAELAELKEEKNRLFRFGGDVCRGVVFIRFEAGVTMKPSEFVHSLLKSKDLTAPSNVCRVLLLIA